MDRKKLTVRDYLIDFCRDEDEIIIEVVTIIKILAEMTKEGERENDIITAPCRKTVKSFFLRTRKSNGF